MSKRDILLNEIDELDKIEDKIKVELERIAYNPSLVDILVDDGEEEYKRVLLQGIAKRTEKLIDDAIKIGEKTAKKLK